MTRTLAAVVFVSLAGSALADDYTVKVEDTPPPKELAEPVRALLDSKAMTVADAKGKAILTVWPRKSLEPKAGGEPGYAGLAETTVLGAVKVPEVWKDYRRQNIKPGVYTLRLGLQPMDGNHMGTAPYNEFALLTPADKDTKPDLLDPKELQEQSKASTVRKHPGIVLLFPNPKPGDKPIVEGKPQEHWVLSYGVPVKGGALGFSLVVAGHSMAE